MGHHHEPAMHATETSTVSQSTYCSEERHPARQLMLMEHPPYIFLLLEGPCLWQFVHHLPFSSSSALHWSVPGNIGTSLVCAG